MSKNWDIRFLRLAREVSTWSKDPSTKVGAIIIDRKKRIVSVGYNGFPRTVKDDKELYNDRAQKYRRVVHAEQNAILFAGKSDFSYHTLYTYPIPPCPNCTPLIIQTGIEKVVTVTTSVADPHYTERLNNWEVVQRLLREANVKYDIYPEFSVNQRI